MSFLKIVLILIFPVVLLAQGLNVTGRVSLRMTDTQYDETSDLKPDSIAADQYAKSSLVPGFRQNLSLALFGRSSELDISLLADIANDEWNQLNRFDNLNRLSLNIRFARNEIVLGDFYESGSDFFIQSRELRGAKAYFVFDNLWNKDSYLETRISLGQVQKKLALGERLPGLYHQYETAGQFRRYFASGLVKLGSRNRYSFGLKYLQANDDDNSIGSSINEPLTNRNIGAESLLYLWKKHLQFFAEGYLSHKDTLTAKDINDHAYKTGLDFRYKRFKLLAFYQRLGYDYYSAGYPYLLNDRQGYKFISAYRFPQILTFGIEGERYKNNLNDDPLLPITTTRRAEAGFTTHFKNWPEFSLKWRFRDDISDTILDTIRTDKVSNAVDGRMAYTLGAHRLSLSLLYINLNDNSILASGSPLGTEQFISSFNFFTRPVDGLFISGGTVYSTLNLTNDQENVNSYTYTSARWDVIPRKLKLEMTVSYIYNDAANGGFQDMLSDYSQFISESSLEYFLNSSVSFKVIAGSDIRHMRYSSSRALSIMADPDYGPYFFNGFETYDGLKYGAEINWIF